MAANETNEWIIPDGTASLLYSLAEHPHAAIGCSLAPSDPAISVYYTPRGCVARPGDQFQALCGQHIETDGIRDGARPILDLTLHEEWSRRAGLELPLRLGFTVVQLEIFLAEIGLQQS